MILDEGRAEGEVAALRRVVVGLGPEKLGSPDSSIAARLAEIDDLAVLERLVRRVLTASTWDELLECESDR